MAVDLPPLPPPFPRGRVRLVDDEGRATLEFASWLSKLDNYLGHLTPPPPAETRSRSKLTLADWLRARVP